MYFINWGSVTNFMFFLIKNYERFLISGQNNILNYGFLFLTVPVYLMDFSVPLYILYF